MAEEIEDLLEEIDLLHHEVDELLEVIVDKEDAIRRLRADKKKIQLQLEQTQELARQLHEALNSGGAAWVL